MRHSSATLLMLMVIALAVVMSAANALWWEPRHPSGEWRVILVDGVTDSEGDIIVKGPSYSDKQECYRHAVQLNAQRQDVFACVLIFKGGAW